MTRLLPQVLPLAAALLLACGPARAEDPRERAVLDQWAALLDTPLDRTSAKDLAWIAEPEASVANTTSASFLLARLEPDLEPLRYLGYRRPKGSPPYDRVHELPADLDRPHHVWRYGDHAYVLTATAGRREQLAAYAVLRALALLRERVPRASQLLFVGPQEPADQLARLRARDPKKPVRFLNLTRCFAFVIDGGYRAIAKSTYDLGTRDPTTLSWKGEPLPELSVFRNVATIRLNLAAMQGYGSHELYQAPDPQDDFLRYLRDGLAETLVHEALHCLLRRDKNVRELFWALTKSVRRLGGERLGRACEEAYVANVSTRLLRGVGLSPQVIAYYQRLFRGQHRRTLGLVAGRETDEGVAIQALLGRYAERPNQPYEDLFWFDLLD